MGGSGLPDTLQYVLVLKQFHVNNTRANDKDTDVVAFTAKVGDLIYPTQIKRMENIQDGDHLVDLYIGPIIAPPLTPVTFSYTIVNSGYDATDTNKARQVSDTLSTIGAAICTAAFGGDNIWSEINKLHQDINKLIFANCDGLVAGDGVFVAMDILKQWTSNGPFHKTPPPYIGTGSAPPPCHGDSNYIVTWNVIPNTDTLDLLGVSSDGHIWHAFRRNDGTWQPFSQVESFSRFVDVSNAGTLDSLLHVYGITAEGGMLETLDVGSPQPSFLDVKKFTSDPGAFNRVGIAPVFGDLHVCGITPDDGNIRHTIRPIPGPRQSINWPAFDNVKSQAGNPGTFVDVSCAGVVGELHVCGITLDGGIWHTIRHVDGSWQAFGDVKSQAGNPGAFVDVGAAGIAGELHLFGLDVNGEVWHTIRYVNGSWTPFGNVTGEAGGHANFLAFSAASLPATWTPPQPPQPPHAAISDPFNHTPFQISVPATSLKSHPIVHGGPYSADAISLQPPLTIQWTGERGTTIISPTAPSTAINFDMTGHTQAGDGLDFQVSVQVTDQLGVSVSDQKTVSIDVTGISKGA